MRRFLRAAIACLLVGGLLGALGHRLNANLALAPTSTGGGPSTTIAFVGDTLLATQSACSLCSVSYTNLSNNNTGLIVPLFVNGGIVINTVTYASVSCAHIGDAIADSTHTISGWYCPVGSLGLGSHTLQSVSSTANTAVTACVEEYSGAAQTTAIEGAATANSSSSTATVNVTTAASNDWVGSMVSSPTGSTTSAGAGFTLRNNCGDYVDSNGPEAPGTYVPSQNFSGASIWGIVGFGLKHG